MWRDRNLQRRTAISVGLFTTVVVLLFGATAWILVARSLQAATDSDLRVTAEAIQTFGLDRFRQNRDSADTDTGGGGGVDGDELFPGFGDADRAFGEGRPPVPYIQLLDNAGADLAEELSSGLPISSRAVAVATGGLEESIESIEFDGRTIRVITVPLEGEQVAALRVGTDITNTRAGLRRARPATTLAGLLAGLGTAGLAWLLSGHLIAPITAVAAAADRVRTEDELPESLDGEGPDELGRLVTSFNAMLDDVRDSRSQQRRLVADASHELRTPLTSLRVKIEFIQAEPELAVAERQRLLNGAVADLESLGDLVSELVELAAEGATSEKAGLVELADVVNNEVDRFKVTSGRTVQVTTTPGVVETRPKQVTRALTNLLVNADKYSPTDLPITVSQVGPRIEVRDHGQGIPEADRIRVFDRFYRGRDHQSIEGSGLGLAIVESIARANGGTTWIDDPQDGETGTVVGFSAGPTVER